MAWQLQSSVIGICARLLFRPLTQEHYYDRIT